MFAGKTILLTGGSRGIGYELAKTLCAQGAMVLSLDIKEPRSPIPGCTTIHADIARGDAVRTALTSVTGPIDILINNAGVMRRGGLLESSEQDFDALFDVGVKGAWLVLREALPFLRPGAMIVQMCSRHALRPPTDPALYALSKQTCMHLAEAVARSHPQFVVKTLFPGPTDTEDVGRYGVEGAALEEKIKIMLPPAVVAEKIMELLASDKTRLEYEEPSGEYVMR
jgi:NAD(P)-dependent dehydrogenase (short-subunit alcohol dehydrogenase family)